MAGIETKENAEHSLKRAAAERRAFYIIKTFITLMHENTTK